MNCEQARERVELDALAPLAGNDAHSLAEHLRACAECRGHAERLAGRIALFRKAMRTDAARDPALQELRRRIRRELAAGRAGRGMRMQLLFLARAAAAVAVCAGLMYAWYALRNRPAGQGAGASWTQAGVAAVAGNETPYPMVTENQVFALVDEPTGKRLLAINRRTGAPLWKTPFSVVGIPCSDSKRVYVWHVADTAGFQLVALNCRTGKKAWMADAGPLAGQANPQPVAARGERLCWSGAGKVVALDARNGKLLWTRSLARDEALSAPVADAERLYVASGETLYALNLESGELCWQRRHEQPGSYLARPLVGCEGGTVVVGLRSALGRGLLQGYRAATGEPLWRRETDAPRHLLAARGKVYLRGAGIQAFDGQTGKPAWSAPLGGCSPVVAAGNKIYVMEGLEGRGVYALNADTGERVWSGQAFSSCSGMAIAEQTGYLVTQDGELRAISVQEGHS